VLVSGCHNELLGVPIGPAGLDQIAVAAWEALDGRRAPLVLGCANPHSLVIASADREFRHALRTCSAVVADGVGVTVAARLFGREVGPRITGSDLFVTVMRELNAQGGRSYFLGSRPEILERIRARATRDFPAVVVETHAPPFGEWSQAENDAILDRIAAFEPDVLWVGMTAPKQEKWVAANLARLRVPVIGSVGAVFDYYAGAVRRAPAIVCAAGLEWLYRLLHEPQRLWRRTFLSGPQFFWLLLRERLTSPRHT
jgi:N-acetylglucosaminyldiphosphoundecaprenol N-acetyl-beta-D-mannosaminyltransferase